MVVHVGRKAAIGANHLNKVRGNNLAPQFYSFYQTFLNTIKFPRIAMQTGYYIGKRKYR